MDEYEIAEIFAQKKRASLKIPVIGVTGSMGKTTMKEMLTMFLGGKETVACNEGSRNIAETMVLNIMAVKPCHKIAVFEFGVDSPGQMREMGNLAKPSIPVFTGIGESHLCNFGSLDEIYREKRNILLSLPKGGKIIANAEDKNLMKYLHEDESIEPDQIITYGFSDSCSVFADDIVSLGPDGFRAVIHAERLGIEAFEISTKIIGKHMLLAMTGAIMTALLFHRDVEDIIKAAERIDYIPHRMQLLRMPRYTVIDDSYNASVASVKCALDFLKSADGEAFSKIHAKRRVAVLGDMLELGDFTRKAHEITGAYACECADAVICIGKAAKIIYSQCNKICADTGKSTECYYFENTEFFLDNKDRILKPGDLILIKASNKMRFDEIPGFLKK